MFQYVWTWIYVAIQMFLFNWRKKKKQIPVQKRQTELMFCLSEVYSADVTENTSFKSTRLPEFKRQLPSFRIKSKDGPSGLLIRRWWWELRWWWWEQGWWWQLQWWWRELRSSARWEERGAHWWCLVDLSLRCCCCCCCCSAGDECEDVTDLNSIRHQQTAKFSPHQSQIQSLMTPSDQVFLAPSPSVDGWVMLYYVFYSSIRWKTWVLILKLRIFCLQDGPEWGSGGIRAQRSPSAWLPWQHLWRRRKRSHHQINRIF